MERLFWSVFITACLWSIAQSKLPESSSQEMKKTLLTSDRVSIVTKKELGVRS